MKRLLLPLALSLALFAAAPAQAEARCGAICLASLKEGTWVADLDLLSPSNLLVYSTHALVVCRKTKKAPVFAHDRILWRQRWICR